MFYFPPAILGALLSLLPPKSFEQNLQELFLYCSGGVEGCGIFQWLAFGPLYFPEMAAKIWRLLQLRQLPQQGQLQ